MMHRMKLTAIVPDSLLKKTIKLAGGANTTESLIIALKEWVASKELAAIVASVREKPLQFTSADVATRIRAMNRE